MWTHRHDIRPLLVQNGDVRVAFWEDMCVVFGS
jgi:hypothetical protein